MCAAMLMLQAVTLFLTTPVLIGVAGVDVTTALWVGLGLTVACLVTAGLLRRRWAYVAGWAIQVASIGLGLVIPMMWFLGLVFGALWATSYVLGAKIDREKGERAVLEAQWQAEHPG